jgi:predicted O-methyltransferase YrrM
MVAAMSAALAEALAAVEDVPGWLTPAQARRLWELAGSVLPGGTVVEIGSYRGRSAILLARAAPPGATIVAVDPHAGNDRGPQQFVGTPEQGEADFLAFHRNLERAGVAGRIRHVRERSHDAHGAVSGEIDLLYVDGSHRYREARDDLSGWGRRVATGGTVAIHDSFSSIGVTLALLRLFVLGREFRYVGRTGTLSEYERRPLSGRERLANSLRQVAELPWFVRNVLVKLALVARLQTVARALGHRSGEWPY